MSIVIAAKTENGVLMGADTQTSHGDYEKVTSLGENGMKITKMPHGILLGHAGSVRVTQILACHKDWFDALGDAPLTKQFLVEEIVPRYYIALRQRGLLKTEDGTTQYGGGFIAAQGDRIYTINRDFSVTEIPSFVSIGCGLDAAYLLRMKDAHKNTSVRGQMLQAMRLAAAVDTAVGEPFVLIDTENLQYEIVEG